MGERTKIAAVAVAALGLVWVFKGHDGSPPGSASAVASGVNAGVYGDCAKIDAKAVLASRDNTIDRIRRSDATDFSGPQIFVHVSTKRWRDAGREGQLSIAIAAYCDAADHAGKGVAIIKGSIDEELGGVVDGNYTSP
ncbi:MULTISPECIES: hypothetical protein [unclassified Mesorhizobium]|uniref:hypothetical protein n=1 Tax=unclassified Mesorhizobium TaxID=325217 RepID=UPI0024166350|nr:MULTISPECIES: hypothetical protein [unclassified Mesorhizobium]MDG4903538.1 hypothetical protein [Mesorhizobium sp. WSM4962]MDG4921412.1 hypothetical protein [Mesorhizobium sp. WSM4989]